MEKIVQKPDDNRLPVKLVKPEQAPYSPSDNLGVYRQLFQESPIPALIFKKDGKNIRLKGFNKTAALKIQNISSKSLEQSVAKIFLSEKEIQNKIVLCLTHKFSSNSEEQLKPKNKSGYKHLLFRYTFISPDMLLVQTEDIKKRRLVEDALTKSKERLELALFSSEAGLWDWNVSTGELVLDENWAGILGYSLDEIEGHISTWEKLINPEDKPRTLEIINAHLEGKTVRYQSEHRLLGKHGNWVWVLDTGKVVARDKRGNPLRMTGTKIDITKRKHMEKELESFNLKLEKMVEERTHRLKLKQRLLLTKKQELNNKTLRLEEVNNALKVLLKKSDENRKESEENMVANLTELVIPYLEKIENKGLNDDQKTFLDIIRSNLGQIVEPFSRKLTSKYLNLTPAEINVANLIKQGKSSKEIAELSFLSFKTIETQRRNIRKKLGITSKKVNLKTYLHTLS
ncbi:MAG: PAS domain-containing protein [Desulfobacterales bacterium]|nr:PAS domain-containing protein [Desulfobacterales bacterium]